MRAQVITMSFLTLAACGDSGPIAGAQNVRPAWGPASNQLFSPEGPSGPRPRRPLPMPASCPRRPGPWTGHR